MTGGLIMYIVINDICIRYANYFFSDKIEFWFNKKRYEFYSNENIKDLGFSADSETELREMLSEYNIIPSFCPNIIEFEKNFIDEYRNKKLSEYFSQFQDEELYDRMFRIYTENNNIDYSKEEYEFYCKSAEDWCRINHISFIKR